MGQAQTTTRTRPYVLSVSDYEVVDQAEYVLGSGEYEAVEAVEAPRPTGSVLGDVSRGLTFHPSETLRGFVQGAGGAVADLARGATAGALSTVYRGGDILRRATGQKRIVESPEVQRVITPPDTAAGKIGFFGEQGAEFAVPLTKLARATQGLSRMGRLATEAVASAGVGAVQSGADPTATAISAVAPAGIRGVIAGGRALRGVAGRAAAGAAEGGVGGAIANVVRRTAPETPKQMLIQGLKPSARNVRFEQALDRAVPELKATEEALGRPIATIDDLAEAIPKAKQRVYAQYEQIAAPAREQGMTVDLSAVATQMRRSIPRKLRVENPKAVAAIEARAAKYEGPFTIDEAEQLLKETNAELDGFYARYPFAQRAALASNPQIAAKEAQARTLRDVIYQRLDDASEGAAPRELKRRYGALMELDEVVTRRANVAKRQQPESLAEQIGKARAAGQYARGAWKIARGDLRGAGDIASAKAGRSTATYLKERQTTDALIKRAFAAVTDRPVPIQIPTRRPVRGLLPSSPVRLGPGPDPSGSIPPVGMPSRYPLSERKALPPARRVIAGPPAPDTSGQIPPVLPENISTGGRGEPLPKGLSDALPETSVSETDAAAERSFMLRWLADDLREMPFQRGGSTVASRRAAYEAADATDEMGKRGMVFNPHVAGTPTLQMFHALGLRGSRPALEKKLEAAIQGTARHPKLEALADAMREAWDGQRFDWDLVSDSTITKLGVRRRDLVSPITSPHETDMPQVRERLWKR